MILQNEPLLDGNERQYVLDCLETNWIGSLGKYINLFEQKWAEYCGVACGVACSSGTTAIHLALAALGIGHGDEVLVPCFTLVADTNMVILVGAKPVLVDVDPRTWCIDPVRIEAKITPRTKAILCVHMYGHPCDMDRLLEIARRHKLLVIEDAAQAHGTEYKGRKAGSLGDIACFSFYSSKTLTTGEGGMVMTNDAALADKMRCMRSQGFEGGGRVYVHRVLGYNYRLTNLQAAIGLAQVEKADEKAAKKRSLAVQYSALLKEEERIRLPIEESWAKSTFWNYSIVIDPKAGPSRSDVMDRMKARGVETRLFFNALHRQPVYREGRDSRYPDVSGSYPVAEHISDWGMCLPSGLALSDAQVREVAEKLRESLG